MSLEATIVKDYESLLSEVNVYRQKYGADALVADISDGDKMINVFCFLNKLSSMLKIPIITKDRDKNKQNIELARNLQTKLDTLLQRANNSIKINAVDNNSLIEYYKKYKCTKYLNYFNHKNLADKAREEFDIINVCVPIFRPISGVVNKSKLAVVVSTTDTAAALSKKGESALEKELATSVAVESSAAGHDLSELTRRYWDLSYTAKLPGSIFKFMELLPKIQEIDSAAGLSEIHLPIVNVIDVKNSKKYGVNEVDMSREEYLQMQEKVHPCYISHTNDELVAGIMSAIVLCNLTEQFKAPQNVLVNITTNIDFAFVKTAATKRDAILELSLQLRALLTKALIGGTFDLESPVFREQYIIYYNIINNFIMHVETRLDAVIYKADFPLEADGYENYKNALVYKLSDIIYKYNLQKHLNRIARVFCF